MSRYQFIAARAYPWPLQQLCRVSGVGCEPHWAALVLFEHAAGRLLGVSWHLVSQMPTDLVLHALK